MISKNVISYVQSLQQKKARYKYHCFVAEGNKIVAELGESDWEFESLFVKEDFLTKNKALCKKYQKSLEIVSDYEMERLSGLQAPQDALAVVKMQSINAFIETGWTLVLDGVQDPGNMGTLIRSAAWFGFNQIVCSLDTVEVYNPKVIQGSMGAFASLPIIYTDLSEYLSKQSRAVYAAILEGKPLSKILFPKEGVLVLGNEGNGIRPELVQLIKNGITIEKAKDSKVESLNVAVAAAILMNSVAGSIS
jgi:TrmH family RNA methyltransferase